MRTYTKEQLRAMPRARLLKALDKARADSSAAHSALIEADRGHETSEETRKIANTGDTLAVAWVAAADCLIALLDERSYRMRYHGSEAPVKATF